MVPEGTGDTSIHSEAAAGSPAVAVRRKDGQEATVKLLAVEEEHWDQVYRLYGQVFGEDMARAFRDRRHWARQGGVCAQGASGWGLVDGDAVVGLLTTVPMRYWIGGAEIVAHTPADYMVHPQYRFHGIKLMREFFRACENCVTCDDMRATIKVAEWLGAKRVGTLVRYVKLLDGRALRSRSVWAKVPSPLWSPVTWALRLVDVVRTRGLTSDVTVEALNSFDERFARFSHDLAQRVPAMPARDLQFFEWRYGDRSPHAAREIGAVTDHTNELVGYVIFHLSGGPSRTGYILDLQALPQANKGITMALLDYALRSLRRRGAWKVQYHNLSSPFGLADEVLRSCGFTPRGAHQFMVNFRDQGLAAVAERQLNWNYSYGDSEASHVLR